MKRLTFLSVLLLSTNSFALTKTLCGKLGLDGSKGVLVRNSETLVTLNKTMLEAAGKFVQLEDKRNFCIKAEVDFAFSRGSDVRYVPVEILDAYKFETVCSSGEEILASGQTTHEANAFIGLNDRGQRGVQRELKYCLDHKLDASGAKVKVIYGYEYRTYCGKLTDYQGSTFLVNPKRQVTLIVAVKNGVPKLLNQARALTNNTLEFGKDYCMDARLHERGWEAEIISVKTM